MEQQVESAEPQPGEVGALMRRIGDGLKTIAGDEVKLARIELLDQLKKPLADAGAIVLGGVLAIIGVGLLCTTAVVALEPLIAALWLRMVLMSVVYFVAGGAVMKIYVNRFQKDATPSAPRAALEAKRTIEAVKEERSVMTEIAEQSESEQTALALQREIQETRQEVVADIDRLREAVRERVSVGYILRTHPRVTQALTIGLGVSGVLALALIWRSTKAARDNATA